MDELVINERERLHAAELVEAHVPIPEWWFKHNALLSFILNASSATVPEAERFIVRTASRAHDRVWDKELRKRAETLVHEETAHARVHDAYNRYLEVCGFPAFAFSDDTKKLVEFFERTVSLETNLAICAMLEHFTAVFSKQLFDYGILEGEDTDERMDRIWSWHSLEELEHRSTAIDLYRELGGGYLRRILAALLASLLFLIAHTRCLLAFLNAKKLVWKWSTWSSGIPYIWGRKGVYRLFLTHWILYFKPGFHPNDIIIENRLQKQLHHYHIEGELVTYFPE